MIDKVNQTLKGQVRTPFGRLTFGILIGYSCMMIALMTPIILLLTFKMMDIDPNGYKSSFGLVEGIGSLFALFGNPLGGTISDRTNIIFGRRRTWILFGPLLGCVMLLWIAMATEVWQVLIGWCLASMFFNFGMAAYTALIPDQVDEKKQGTISGLMGLATPIGIAGGMVLMMSISSEPSFTKWLLISIIGVVGPIISLFFIRDGKVEMEKIEKEKLTLVEKINKVYPNPRQFPEFTWALVSKFLLIMGFASASYLTIMLVDRMGFNESQATDKGGLLQIIALLAIALTSLLGGVLSDKIQKQKPFLYVSAFIIIIGLLIFAFVPSFSAYMIAIAIIGLGTGCFLAVDMALVARILPNKEDSAKDFGIMNVANALPQTIVPATAPLLLGMGGWSLFYIVLAGCVFLGMFAVRPLPEIVQHRDEKLEKAFEIN